VAVGEERGQIQKPEALQLLDKVMPEEIIFLKVGSVLLVEAGEPDLLEQRLLPTKEETVVLVLIGIV
jgi:hypothetical protein